MNVTRIVRFGVSSALFDIAGEETTYRRATTSEPACRVEKGGEPSEW